MESLIHMWRPRMAAVIVLSLVAYASSALGVLVRPGAVALRDWAHMEPFPAYLGEQDSQAAAFGAETVARDAEVPQAGGSQTAQSLYGQGDEDADDWDMIYLGQQLRESSFLDKAFTKDFTSCSVSFPYGYTAPPVVEVTGEGAGHETATAVFIDESANCWLHGVYKGFSIPSSFSFGMEGTDGDYASIHPPRGSGKHTYTVVVYKGSLDSGPLLRSLQRTPWSNRKRAVGSLKAIEDDFRQQNIGKPVEELCRCSVLVSHEDIAEQQ